MKITRTSDLTGVTRSLELDVTREQIGFWKVGMHIQDAMPQLSDADREFIKTGITAEEWDEAFPEEKTDPTH